MTSRTRVGVMGLGWPGREHLKAYASMPNVEVVAIADADETRLQEQARAYNLPAKYLDYRTMLENEALDAVSVCLPNFLHYEASAEALQRGVHVLCEKPPTLKAAEAMALHELATEKGCKLMYAFSVRFTPGAQLIKKVAEDGELGEIYFGHAIYLRRRGIPIGKGGWFVDKARAGGGALIDIGVHVLDCTWWLMGCPDPVSVSGSAYTKFKALVPEDIHFDVDDAAFALVKFANGATILLETSWALNLPNQHNVIVSGTKGGAQLSPLTIFSECKGAPCEISPQPAEQNSVQAECAHFIDCIRMNKEPISSSLQGYRLMQMLDAIYESADTGKEVRVADRA